MLAKIADKLPIQWTEKEITVGDRKYPAAKHVPILIYPNPLNPTRYVVLNSGFTWRVAGGGRGGGRNSRNSPIGRSSTWILRPTRWFLGKSSRRISSTSSGI